MKEEKTTTTATFLLGFAPIYDADPDINLEEELFDVRGNIIVMEDNVKNPLPLDQQTCLFVRLARHKADADDLLDLKYKLSTTVKERLEDITDLLNRIKKDLEPGGILGSTHNTECDPLIDLEIDNIGPKFILCQTGAMVPYTILSILSVFGNKSCSRSRELSKDVRLHRNMLWKLYCDLWKKRDEISLSYNRKVLAAMEKAEE